MVRANRKRVHCVVVSVPAAGDPWTSRGALAHDLVPEADPYVAQLIKRLQDEVRQERAARRRWRQESLRPTNRLSGIRRVTADLSADLEVPWFEVPWEDDPLGDGDELQREFGEPSHDDLANYSN